MDFIIKFKSHTLGSEIQIIKWFSHIAFQYFDLTWNVHIQFHFKIIHLNKFQMILHISNHSIFNIQPVSNFYFKYSFLKPFHSTFKFLKSKYILFQNQTSFLKNLFHLILLNKFQNIWPIGPVYIIFSPIGQVVLISI